ncbi:complement factor H-like isoform X1 [Hemibagrus wyckioides]|uniref:complement factor H-like isoform X1 n=1 Tax=Hemibagrus wyckioides TaxID=337641 RepID=UPI00266BB573|nr:complement factor H-like isoform X1 [Hemibagrus wyckioides]
MKIIILVFLVFSCLAVRGINSCLFPSVPNAQPRSDLKDSYSSGETVRFECNQGYGFEGTHYAVCDNGTWRLPVCKDATCTAPHVENAKPEKELETSYAGGDTVKFVCDSNYELEGTYYALCDDGTWSLPVCKERITCGKPEVQYSERDSTLRDSYSMGERVQFQCRSSYEFADRDYAECEETGTWRLPVCRRNCPHFKNTEQHGDYLLKTKSFHWKSFTSDFPISLDWLCFILVRWKTCRFINQKKKTKNNR